MTETFRLRLRLLAAPLCFAASLPAITISNPGFESDFTGWSDTDPSAISTSDVHSGSKAAKITGSAGRIEQTLSVNTNTDYTLTAWVYALGTVGVVVGTNDYYESGNYGSYTEVTVDFNSGSQSAVTIYAAYNGGTGRFDDFTLEEDSSGGGSGTEELLSINAVDASSDDGNVPGNTLDGNFSTRWSAQGDGEWIRYELAAEATVTSIDIAFYQGDQRTTDFEVEVSTNGTSWTSVLSLTSSSGSTTGFETFDVTDTVATWVRIVGYGNSSNNWNSLTEVDVYGEPTGGGSSGAIDFSSLSRTAYGNNGGTYQDGTGSDQSQDSGATLYLDGNRWRDVPFNYTVTADTVLEFDFKSTAQGEIQAIGFDNNDDQEDTLRAFYLYGSQGWNNSYGASSSPSFPAYTGSGSWVTYQVYVGDFYTGTFDRIFFVNDGDSTTGNSYFRNVTVYEDTTGGGGGGGGGTLDPNAPPGDNFDLSTWKITFPDASEEQEAWLTGGGESANEFYTDPNTGGMVFRCPNNGGSTSGSSYSRTELREMLRAGDTSISTTGLNKNNWVFSTSSSSNQSAAGGVDGTLEATLTVDHVSTTGDSSKVGRVIVGQIHASNDEPCRLYYRKLPGNSKGSIYFAHEPTSGSEQWYEMIGSRSSSASNPSDGIELGEEWSYVIDVEGDTLTVTIKRDGKSDVVEVVDMSNSGFANDWMYFKAGVYNQNNTGDSGDYAQATFYELRNTHY